MKESEFIRQNKDKWTEFESIISKKKNIPEELGDVFIQVTDDLSYSRSFYNNRSVRVYLNSLAQSIFNKLNRRKKIRLGNMKAFFTRTVPKLLYEAKREMLVSFLVFILSMCIGIYSSIKNPTFSQLILGEKYVEMTEQNIENGDPMAVYKSGKSIEGFLSILINNARIDILLLGLGMLFGVGAILVLIHNGIMVGVFQYFFYAHGGFKDSLLTIWLHGTIEITTIIIIGGIGLLAGRGWLFPGTYTRVESFKTTAKQAGLLTLGVLPFTFVAAIIEGFITRQTGAPNVLKVFLILLSLIFVIYYFYLYPRLIVSKHGTYKTRKRKSKEKIPETKLYVVKSINQCLIQSIKSVRGKIAYFIFGSLFGSLLFLVVCFLVYPQQVLQTHISGLLSIYFKYLFKAEHILDRSLVTSAPAYFYILQSILYSTISAYFYLLIRQELVKTKIRKFKSFVILFLLALPIWYFFIQSTTTIVQLGFHALLVVSIFFTEYIMRTGKAKKDGINLLSLLTKSIGGLIAIAFITFILTRLIQNLVDAQLSSILFSLLIDFIPEGIVSTQTLLHYWLAFFRYFFFFFSFSITASIVIIYFYSVVEKQFSPSLEDELHTINPTYFAKINEK